MADEKKSFLLYLDYREHFELLDDEGKGRLLMALFEYAESGRILELSGMEKMAFSFIRKQMDKDSQKWEETKHKRQAAGRKGGIQSGASRNEAKPPFASTVEANTSTVKQTQANEAVKDNVNVNVNVINPPHKSPQGDDVALQAESLKVETAGGAGKPVDHSKTLDKQRFEEYWGECPKKMGKGAAEKAWMKIRPDKELFEKIMSALRAMKQTEQWQRDNGRYIPMPSTWLNQRRWEDEIPDGWETSTRNHEQTNRGSDFCIPGITEL